MEITEDAVRAARAARVCPVTGLFLDGSGPQLSIDKTKRLAEQEALAERSRH